MSCESVWGNSVRKFINKSKNEGVLWIIYGHLLKHDQGTATHSKKNLPIAYEYVKEIIDIFRRMSDEL